MAVSGFPLAAIFWEKLGAFMAKKNRKRKVSDKQLKAIRRNYAIKAQKRTKGGKVPQGRTLTTNDKYLSSEKKTGSQKERPIVVIEANQNNDLAVVPLSSRNGRNRTRLKNYQQGQSYFKHYVEIEDDEGKPIHINEKFKENHPNMDVSSEDIIFIRDTVLNKSLPKQANQKKMDKFHKKDK